MTQVVRAEKPGYSKLLAPMSGVIILLMTSFILIYANQQLSVFKDETQTKVNSVALELQLAVGAQTQLIEALQDTVLLLPGIADAVKNKQKDVLNDACQALFMRYKKHYNITHFYFHDGRRTNIVRVHKPEKWGDTIDRHTTLEAERTGQVASGLELGPLGTFTLRVVRPLFIDSTCVGYLELGKEVEDILSIITTKHTVALSMAIEKRFLKRSLWEQGMMMLGRKPNWELFGDDVVTYTSLESFPDALRTFVNGEDAYKAMSYYTSECAKVAVDDKNLYVTTQPLYDVAEQQVGHLLISNDVSEKNVTLTKNIVMTVIVMAIVLVLSFCFLYLLFRSADREIEKSNHMLQESNDQIMHINQQLRAEELKLAASNKQLQEQESQRETALRATDALNMQLKENEQQLTSANKELTSREQKLKASEEALIAKVKDMERLYDVMLDRESRVVEIKKEVNELCKELDRPARYSESI